MFGLDLGFGFGFGLGLGFGFGQLDRLAALRAVRARDRVEVLALLHGVTGRVALLRALEEALATGRADARGRGVALLEGRELERYRRLQPADLVRVRIRIRIRVRDSVSVRVRVCVFRPLTSSSSPSASSEKARVGEPRVAFPMSTPRTSLGLDQSTAPMDSTSGSWLGLG